VVHLSGRQLLVSAEERLELPKGMVYFSDLPGLPVVDEKGDRLGTIVEVRETGTIEYLVIRATRGDISVPWNDHFVKRIDLESKVVELDVTSLRGILF
jgi:16S rRNA processing protein RimM